MGELADKLNSAVVRETSPDGQISATQVNGDHITVQFRPGTYRRYDEWLLGGELADLAQAVRASCQRNYYQAISEVTGRPVASRDANRGRDSRDRHYRDARKELQVTVTSPGGWITAETEGLDHWSVGLRGGVLRALTEQEFIAEAMTTLNAVLREFRMRDHELRNEFFDLRLPKGNSHA